MTQSTVSRIFVCDAAALGDKEIRQVELDDAQPLAVYRIGTEFFATEDTCTHGQASLSEGEVDDEGQVECPWHGGTFCVRSGKATGFPAVLPLKTFPIHVEDGKLYVDLSPSSDA